MISHIARRVLPLLTIGLLALSFPGSGASQTKLTKDQERLKTASERSASSVEILKQVAALPEGKGIPKEITDKMNLIGVLSDAAQISLLVSKAFGGSGVSSLRQDGKWSMPAFYAFSQSNGVDFTGVSYKHFAIIMVVVNAQIKSRKEKDKDKAKPPAPPNNGTDDKPRSYVYIFSDGVLRPVKLRTGFFNSLLGAGAFLAYEDKINKTVYGVKGDDVLLTKYDGTRALPAEVTAFRDTVTQLYPNTTKPSP